MQDPTIPITGLDGRTTITWKLTPLARFPSYYPPRPHQELSAFPPFITTELWHYRCRLAPQDTPLAMRQWGFRTFVRYFNFDSPRRRKKADTARSRRRRRILKANGLGDQADLLRQVKRHLPDVSGLSGWVNLVAPLIGRADFRVVATARYVTFIATPVLPHGYLWLPESRATLHPIRNDYFLIHAPVSVRIGLRDVVPCAPGQPLTIPPDETPDRPRIDPDLKPLIDEDEEIATGLAAYSVHTGEMYWEPEVPDVLPRDARRTPGSPLPDPGGMPELEPETYRDYIPRGLPDFRWFTGKLGRFNPLDEIAAPHPGGGQ